KLDCLKCGFRPKRLKMRKIDDVDMIRQKAKLRKAFSHRLTRLRTPESAGFYQEHTGGIDKPGSEDRKQDVVVDCGWGRLLFAQTFDTNEAIIEALRAEAPANRDIVFYVSDPHVLLSLAPQEVFLDPSHTYRLELATYRPGGRRTRGITIRRAVSELDVEGINAVYAACGMVQLRPDFFSSERNSRAVTYFVAQDDITGEIVGTVTGIDHHQLFDDPDGGASLWCLAVHPQARQPGIGEKLVRKLAEHFQARGLSHIDLSVLHDNEHAIRLYEKLNFRRVPLFAVKRKNAINEKFFASQLDCFDALNPYARIIVDEAVRRGIQVEVTDAEGGFFRLSNGGRTVHCRESLSEMTSAVAMSICDDKAVTRRIVSQAGLTVPDQIPAEAGETALQEFLNKHGKVVVKPARGEQGQGISVGVSTIKDLHAAIKIARSVCDRVLIEACFEGEDLRLVIIDYQLVAAAVRRPPKVIGDGKSTIRKLIDVQSRRRSAATGGESKIPIDAETRRCLEEQGLSLGTVLEDLREVTVRKAANLHAGGTIHDVTTNVHPHLVKAACTAAKAIGIPVTGIDFMVKDPEKPEYIFV